MFIVHIAQNCIVCHLHQICGDLRSNSTPIRHSGSDWKNRFGHIPKQIRLTFIQYISAVPDDGAASGCVTKGIEHTATILVYFSFFVFLLCLVVWKQLPAMVLVGMACVNNPISWFFHKQICYTDTNARHEVLELILNTKALGRMKYKVWWCARGARVFVLYPFHSMPSIALFRFGLILPVLYTPISYQLLLFIPLVNTKLQATDIWLCVDVRETNVSLGCGLFHFCFQVFFLLFGSQQLVGISLSTTCYIGYTWNLWNLNLL